MKIALEQTAFASHHINMRHEEQEQFPNNLVNNVRSFMRPGGRVQLGRAKDSDRPAPLRKGITQEMMDDPQRRWDLQPVPTSIPISKGQALPLLDSTACPGRTAKHTAENFLQL